MPSPKPTLTRDTVGGERENACADEKRRAYAIRQVRSLYLSSYVLAALPEHGSPPLGAVEISKIAHYGARSTVRTLLSSMVTLGIAKRESIPAAHGGFKYVYTRAPSISPDDFDKRGMLVYEDAAE